MYEIARKIVPQHVKGVEVVQLKGGISHSSVNTYANETIALFADAFQTTPRNLPLPVIFDNAVTKRISRAGSTYSSHYRNGETSEYCNFHCRNSARRSAIIPIRLFR